MRKIYVLSDATGQSALDILRAALVQYEHPQVRITIFPKIESKPKLRTILDMAKTEEGLVAFTFVKREFRDHVNAYCQKHHIVHLDLLGPIISNLSAYLGREPLEKPTLLRKVDERYFKRIEAIEFTMDHDDGRGLKRFEEADVVILGLSRTSKTPTSFFLAQQGFKVVNIPIIPEIPLPDELHTIDQSKIVCLIMDPVVLRKVRMARLHHYKTDSSYTDIKKIYQETEYIEELLRRNKRWKVIDTTNKSVEETAREIIYAVFGGDVEYY
jgi:regulator of PEP synthase PpsR (kinase-PPPase family)